MAKLIQMVFCKYYLIMHPLNKIWQLIKLAFQKWINEILFFPWCALALYIWNAYKKKLSWKYYKIV